MSEMRKALNEYLAVRRALGFKLEKEGRLLQNFVDFLQRQEAAFITRDLAVRWAMDSPHGQPAWWASRLYMVRGFAKYRVGADPRTQIPLPGLLPPRYRRKSPYVYSDGEIGKLIGAAQQLRSPRGLRATAFSTLFGLLTVAGLRIAVQSGRHAAPQPIYLS
jgi:site-specific recombinase XerD